MLHFYVGPNNRVLLVDNAKIKLDDHDRALGLKFECCRLPDVVHLGGGIYDAIVFPANPPSGVLRKAIEKIYWGGVVIILGIEQLIEETGYQILRGDPGPLVLRRPPLPEPWTEEYFMQFPKGGEEWDPVSKKMHQRYRNKFDAIDAEWNGTTVLEYGCGRGEITRLISLAGVEKVYGIDTASAAIDMASKFCDDLQNVELLCADAVQWRCPEQCDVIVALDFVEHVEEEDLPQLWSAMFHNLKPGGLVHIVTPLGPDHVRDHKWVPSPKLLREKLEVAGFKYKRHVRPVDSRKFLIEGVK